jgi:hypothetical protein
MEQVPRIALMQSVEGDLCQSGQQNIITRQQSITNTLRDTTKKLQGTTKPESTKWPHTMRT